MSDNKPRVICRECKYYLFPGGESVPGIVYSGCIHSSTQRPDKFHHIYGLERGWLGDSACSMNLKGDCKFFEPRTLGQQLALPLIVAVILSLVAWGIISSNFS